MTSTEGKDRTEFWGGIDDAPEGNVPEPIRLTPEQYEEARAREQERRREWRAITKALRDNSMAVTRAMSRWHPRPEDRERATAAVMSQFENGSFLLNRLGAEAVIDQDLATVLLHLRNGLIEEYGSGPAAIMLIDSAVAAYQSLLRIEGWIGNLCILIEHEFFGIEGPSTNFKNKYGSEGRRIRGLIVEEHLGQVREHLLPTAERCGRAMQEALAALETFVAEPSRAVERSRPTRYSLDWGSDFRHRLWEHRA